MHNANPTSIFLHSLIHSSISQSEIGWMPLRRKRSSLHVAIAMTVTVFRGIGLRMNRACHWSVSVTHDHHSVFCFRVTYAFPINGFLW
jgi:uncharacterized membrane protein YcfT